MKVRYIGQSFGVDSLTSNKIYECIGIDLPFIRVIDDSGKIISTLHQGRGLLMEVSLSGNGRL